MTNTREKLIKLIHYCTSCEECRDEDIADHLIANGVTVQDSKVVEIDQFNKWIPVTERLPEEWVDVLVLSRYGFCEVAVYLGIPGKWRITWNHDLFEVDSITHWMPLPTPPKGE